jgi:2-haloacid dehalogenase
MRSVSSGRRPIRAEEHAIAVPTAVVFDLGAVLIDWDARYLYRSLLPDDEAIATFMRDVGFADWNDALDAGRDWDEAVEWLAERHPERRALIEAFRDRWEETLGDEIEPVVDVLRELVDAGVRTFALSNWSRRTYDIARHRFPFLGWFEGLVISGDEGVTKPDPAIYRALLERYGIRAEDSVFIDDRAANVEVAEALGFHGVQLVPGVDLRERLRALGLPVARQRAPTA